MKRRLDQAKAIRLLFERAKAHFSDADPAEAKASAKAELDTDLGPDWRAVVMVPGTEVMPEEDIDGEQESCEPDDDMVDAARAKLLDEGESAELMPDADPATTASAPARTARVIAKIRALLDSIE